MNSLGELTQMIIGIFEVYNTTNVPMVNHVKYLIYLFGLLDKVITHVKYEGSILSTFTCALTFVIFCSTLKTLLEIWHFATVLCNWFPVACDTCNWKFA